MNGLWGWEEGQSGILATREGMKGNSHQKRALTLMIFTKDPTIVKW